MRCKKLPAKYTNYPELHSSIPQWLCLMSLKQLVVYLNGNVIVILDDLRGCYILDLSRLFFFSRFAAAQAASPKP